MPFLDEISYSRDGTIAAVRDYYQFITKMYLKETDIIEPPEDGWASLSTHLQCMGKTDEVLGLLSQLPYLQSPSDIRDQAQGAPWCEFVDWRAQAALVENGKIDGDKLRMLSEGLPGLEYRDDIPPYVVGLTMGSGDLNPTFLLDTQHGIVTWYGITEEMRESAVTVADPVDDDPYDYAASEREAEWRAEGHSWAIADFFTVLKSKFSDLDWVPLGRHRVIDVYTIMHPSSDGVIPMLREIYHSYGWPDLENYRKYECLQRVQAALEEHYPDLADRREDS
ncbi:hypothetical protein GQX73_g872 [Xylaria multiplex]|uniref:Uncharacterized protein n=1 Tax=Xylaria multiplex TaxID=323545 RepID=A0A7C8J1D8_9PEZI|nr:hypothetical protein GQX73_g872 [Xylaria multiplex]